ncbi:MAG: tRNA (adenosine(37)-N6)-threonylcarbamoyltransferase complex ATPase subunit type 1 TsaE [Nitrospirae bacterium]|nr:MAG: tRNA (adenosine(37)-N6)-threonylcarbamoyltransferase complex ATPase subunit type 1 TsaE [Nitrospirota bacterium]
MNTVRLKTTSEEQTKDIAERLAEKLRPGDSIFLYGDLGVGKTVFVKGIARGLGIDEDEITSASFVIISEHQGRLPLYHIDLYRLAPEATDTLGLEDYIGSEGVSVVEWADRLSEWEPTYEVYIVMKGPETREITIKTAEPVEEFLKSQESPNFAD